MRENVRLFESMDDALQWVEDRILAENMPVHPGNEAALTPCDLGLPHQFSGCAERKVVERCVRERSLAAGEWVFRAGDRADELFLIRRGVVRIVLPLREGGHHNLASYGRGNFFGAVAFLDGGTRTADALATVPTDLYVLSRARFDAMALGQPAVGLGVFTVLARALALLLRRSDAEIRALYDA